jgi:hypothetical protein
MARDSISNPAVSKTIIIETFHEPVHSQNNDTCIANKLSVLLP